MNYNVDEKGYYGGFGGAFGEKRLKKGKNLRLPWNGFPALP